MSEARHQRHVVAEHDVDRSGAVGFHRSAPEAFAGRHSRPTLPNALSISGQNSSTMASVVIEPTRPFDQNTFMSPPEPIIDNRNASSARLPSTSASVHGASGMPIFLKT